VAKKGAKCGSVSKNPNYATKPLRLAHLILQEEAGTMDLVTVVAITGIAGGIAGVLSLVYTVWKDWPEIKDRFLARITVGIIATVAGVTILPTFSAVIGGVIGWVIGGAKGGMIGGFIGMMIGYMLAAAILDPVIDRWMR
jgi:hypothetical protein